MIRIGSFAAQNLTLSKNMEIQARMHEARLQISTGKKAQVYDGIAQDVRRLEGLETQHSRGKAFFESAQRTEQRLAEMETSVAQLADIASDFRTNLLQAASAGNLDDTNIQGEANALLRQAASLMNAEHEGRYLFAGSRTDTKPVELFDAAGNILAFQDAGGDDFRVGDYYKGNDDTLAARVDHDFTLAYGVSANPEETTGFHDLIKALSRVATAPDLATLDQEVENALRDLAGGKIAFESKLDGITDPTTGVGAITTGGTLTFTRADGTTATATYNAGDSLEDLAVAISAVDGIDAETVNDDGDIHLRVYSDGDSALQLTGDTGNAQAALNLNVSGARTDGAIKRLADTQADIGSSRDVLERTMNRLEENRLNVEQGITEIENADVARAMTELSGHRVTLESSYAVTARMSQLSLLNFLR